MTTSIVEKPTLRRELGVFSIFSIAFGAIVGVGWITVLGAWLSTAGSLGAVIAFVLGCLIVMLVVFAYAELSGMFPILGGDVAFAVAGFGAPGGFFVGWLLLLAYIGAFAFEMISVGWIVSTLFPEVRGAVAYQWLGTPVYFGELVVGATTLLGIALTNVRSTRAAAVLQDAMTIGLLVLCALFVVAASWRGTAGNLVPWFVGDSGDGSYGMTGVLLVLASSLFFYAGFNFATQTLSERAKGVSERAIGVALVLSVLAAFVFYVSIILSTASLMPRDELLAYDLPTASAFQAAFESSLLGKLVLFAGLLGLVTSWNAVIIAGSRVLLTLSSLGLLPSRLGRVSHRGTPIPAITVICVLGALIALLGRAGVLPLASLAGVCIAAVWSIVAASALKLRISQPGARRPFRVSAGRLVFGAAWVVTLGTVAFAVFEWFTTSTTGTIPVQLPLLGAWSLLGVILYFAIPAGQRSEPIARLLFHLGRSAENA